MKKLLDLPKDAVKVLTQEAKDNRTQFKPYAELLLMTAAAEITARKLRRKQYNTTLVDSSESQVVMGNHGNKK